MPKESSSIYHSIRSPVCCTAIQVALVTLLSSWGVKPIAVVGHSAGICLQHFIWADKD